MTLGEKEMLDVMAYADGELDAAEAARVEALVAESADARELVASIRALGEGVRAAAPAPGEIDVTADVMGQLVPNELDRARLKRQGRVRVAFVAASIAALAAGVFFYVRQQGAEPRQASMGSGGVPAVTAPAPQATAPVPTPDPSGALAQLGSRSVEVDSVDTGSHAVSVFYVDNAPAAGTPAQSVVVWIDDSNGAQ